MQNSSLKHWLLRPAALAGVSVLAVGAMLIPAAARANHPVLVEGEQDFDGDGNIGLAEDTDGDQIFGTINAALTGGNRRITVVTSGRFAESITITGLGGSVTLEAAPGVEANIDAVLTGANEPRNADFPNETNGGRQAGTGISITADGNVYVTLRNLVIRNWSTGVEVMGNAGVLIDNCRLENNLNRGIFVSGNAPVAITGTTVSSTGFRNNPGPGNAPDDLAPAPGNGIVFLNNSTGIVTKSVITGNFAAGIANETGNRRAIVVRDTVLFDNNPDTLNVRVSR